MPEKAFSVCIKDSVFIDLACCSGGNLIQSGDFVKAAGIGANSFNHDALNLNGEFKYIMTIVELSHRCPYTYSSKPYKIFVLILYKHTKFKKIQ